uniref:DNA2/NAM7 helicase-like C-terminal domain-containing protein n=1 Tax=Panagrolaimus sp. PS1159 TaxID=55785 RepID=A0AC35FC04_9BILA
MVVSKKDKKFVDPIQKVERHMGAPFMNQLGGSIHEGKIIKLQLVKYPNETRYLDGNHGYFSPLVKTPINCKVNTATRHQVCAIVKASPDAPQYTELRLDPTNKDMPRSLKDVGAAIWLALTVVESRNTQDKKSCTYLTEDGRWEADDKDARLSIEIVHTEKINLKNFAQAFSKGALACIRDGQTLASPENRPLTMLVDKVEFDADLKKVIIQLITPMKLVKEVYELEEGQMPPKKVQLTPSSDSIGGKELAINLMKNNLPMFEDGKPREPKNLFLAALKVPIGNPNVYLIEKAVDIPKFLTEDQRRVVIEAVLKKHPVILCQAVAGAGKTTVIVEMIKLLRQYYPDKTPVMMSTGNVPARHVCEALVTESVKEVEEAKVDETTKDVEEMQIDDSTIQICKALVNEKVPPLLISSMIAIKKLSPEDAKKIEKCSPLSHIVETLKVQGLTEAETEKLNKALTVEATLNAELVDTFADAELRDAINAATYIYDDLLGAYQSQIIDFEDEEGETETAKEQGRTNDKESRAKIMKDAIAIIHQRRRPCCYAGTAVMVNRMGPAFIGIVDTVIADEAATLSQIDLLSNLAQIQTVTSFVAVGDSNQLKVYSKNIHPSVMRLGFESALEVMEQNTGSGVISLALNTTFRFHPSILKMVNEICYPEMELKTTITAEEREGFEKIFNTLGKAPILLIHCGGEESPYFPLSSKNDSQTKTAVQVVQKIAEHGEAASIISLYNGQKMVMRDLLQDTQHVCASVDSFQGQEDKYVVVVTTKTMNLEGNKFFSNIQRRTVALTRAQNGIVIIGDVNALRKAPAWAGLVEYCEKNLLIAYNWPPEQ